MHYIECILIWGGERKSGSGFARNHCDKPKSLSGELVQFVTGRARGISSRPFCVEVRRPLAVMVLA
ncbi:hypothetical protein SAMN05421779_11015 [Insolitispirillum peregrinum]|uniref:Uncharacterized protein n=1 Tax=Insolitispirillum peregrinum TaxID=80876 RepID=A0A1N7Q3F8_9PROT|nr:hypothetical protein SAMN05421779_11015 [Insolitispirillum peregrinum]